MGVGEIGNAGDYGHVGSLRATRDVTKSNCRFLHFASLSVGMTVVLICAECCRWGLIRRFEWQSEQRTESPSL